MSQNVKTIRRPIGLLSFVLITWAVFACVSIPSLVIVYLGTPYTVDKATAYLQGTTMTNDPDTKIRVMNEALTMLQTTKGNSGWFAPDVKSDIDNTKSLLASVITESSKQVHALDVGQENNLIVKGMSHKEMNDYVDQQVVSISERLEIYSETYMFNPTLSPLLYILLAVPLAIILPFKLETLDYNRYRNDGRR